MQDLQRQSTAPDPVQAALGLRARVLQRGVVVAVVMAAVAVVMAEVKVMVVVVVLKLLSVVGIVEEHGLPFEPAVSDGLVQQLEAVDLGLERLLVVPMVMLPLPLLLLRLLLTLTMAAGQHLQQRRVDHLLSLDSLSFSFSAASSLLQLLQPWHLWLIATLIFVQ